MNEPARRTVITFRLTSRERRELDLLARAEQKSRSELLRELVRDRVDEATRPRGRGRD